MNIKTEKLKKEPTYHQFQYKCGKCQCPLPAAAASEVHINTSYKYTYFLKACITNSSWGRAGCVCVCVWGGGGVSSFQDLPR